MKIRGVLLTWNKNLQTWIPVGGHVDKGESPMEAIRREVEEETGLEFDLHGDFKRESGGKVEVIKMHRFQLEAIPHHGTHMNFVFFGRALSQTDRNETDEGEKLKWFSKKEILKEDMLDNVKSSALRALEVVRF